MSISISTERLLIRQLRVEEAPLALAYVLKNKAYLSRYEPPRSKEYYELSFWEAAIQQIIKNAEEDRGYSLDIFLKGKEDEIIGALNFSNVVRGAFQACVVGYAISREYQGNGYMSEALAAGVTYMFEQKNFHRIMANYEPDNKASEKVLLKSGFKKEGQAKDYLYLGGAWRDHILTSRINPNWKPPG